MRWTCCFSLPAILSPVTIHLQDRANLSSALLICPISLLVFIHAHGSCPLLCPGSYYSTAYQQQQQWSSFSEDI